ncbi:hypothetical protein FQP90_12040 [Paenarthrobacter nitroguajacolicus]|uniref:Uncharacterized protein n=1 Tax=Paenarthrobacter nitroguajacolicus TaxID=211146 RepID=A0A558GZV7_PAENT|nr:hypothetical protein [Paenarthrobacter nitroguajacolicus]TVU62366.1 hypothetical protein FQP90_12040 [Paenarthrobacter nitroguajacolicus]
MSAVFLMLGGVSFVAGIERDVKEADSSGLVAGKVPGQKSPEPTYPISGYFIMASSRDTTNQKKLADIKALGGDTVITFGTSLQPATLASMPGDCLIDGKPCARVASGSLSVDRYFTFLDGSNWGDSALKCPNDRTVNNNGQTYSVLVLPNSGQGCTSSDGKYDVVVAGGGSSSAVDPSHSLANAATDLGMKFYAGLPAPVRGNELAYLPDLSYQATLAVFTERFLAYQADANDIPGLAGFYHHTEMPLTDSSVFDPILDLYTNQNRAIRRILPTREAIVSPYIDSRTANAGISLDKVKTGIRRIAQTSGGLGLNIAIQDGMGTGKGAAFSESEANSAVDPFAATIVGQGPWGAKYIAPNKDYFSAAATGISGTGAVLWANVEGMAPVTNANTCGDSRRGQTTKARLDRQLQQVATAKKIVSFMWDSYFTCKGTGTTLREQVESGASTPIVTDTTFKPSTGQVEVVGFNLEGSKVTVKWTNQKGQQLEKSVKANTPDSTYGIQKGMNPRLEKVSVNVGVTTRNASKDYTVELTNGWGKKATEFRSQLP